jgi:tetratricopeptide (TPR) repeat protein
VKLTLGLLSIIAAVAVFPGVAHSAPASGYPNSVAKDEGIGHLNHGRFQTAEAYFLQAIRENPKDPMVHYYLATTLVYLHKHQDAIKQYQTCYRLDPYGQVSGYCRRALKTYGAQIPDSDTASSVKIIAAAPASLPAANAKLAAAADLPAVDELPSDGRIAGINGAINKIRAEAESEKYRMHVVNDRLSALEIKNGESVAASIQAQAKEDIDKVLNPPPLIVNGRSMPNPLVWNPELQKEKIAQIQRNAEEAANLARNKAIEKAAVYKQRSQDHDQLLDDSAASLEVQLHTRNLPGTPRLSHAGTGLFVRNYDSAEQPNPYPEAHQGVARIHRALTGPQNADENNQSELKAKELYDVGDRPGNTVHGTVLTKAPVQ